MKRSTYHIEKYACICSPSAQIHRLTIVKTANEHMIQFAKDRIEIDWTESN